MSELLPRPVRLALGATSRGVGERRLRSALAGRTVLITGASSGVGAAAALRLTAAGATALLVARRAELLDGLAERITATGGRAHAHPCDLADPDAIDALVADVLARHGHVDVVVSNAGISIRRWISESYERFRDIERTIAVNYLGPVRLLLGLLPSMRERRRGHIVNVATVGVDLPPLRWSAYVASKAAFETWLRGAAPELRADGVTTTSIHLQLVRSPMLGPFRAWGYLPGMSSEEAAGIIARAIVERPRVIAPGWARLAGAATGLAQAPLELALAAYSARANPESRDRSSPDSRDRTRPGGRTRPSIPVRHPGRLATQAVGSVRTIAAARVIRPVRPDRAIRAALAAQRYGATPAAGLAVAAQLHPDRPAIIDELGSLTFAELDRDARALAAGLATRHDVTAGDRVGVMCRNHRGFVQGAAAATRLGCDFVPLNTDFAGPQLGDVLEREGVHTIIADEEFNPVLDDAGFSGLRIMASIDADSAVPTIASLIFSSDRDAPPVPPAPGRIITLTSGTTGTPKGATRTIDPVALAPVALAGLLDLSRIRPVPRSGQPIVVGPPLFHLYGFTAMLAAFAFGSPIVIRRRFEPEAMLAQVDATRAGLLLAVPTMLRRLVALPDAEWERHDTSSLRMVMSAAAPLAPELATAVMDRVGEILYNAYASTEAGSGTLATPADLRAAPGTVGRPFAGITIKILDEHGREQRPGAAGRIFVGSPLLFDGYTGGGSKEVIDGRMSTGDVGHVDADGRLFIDGRDDEMIVSGGENVFPQEVEDLLIAHPAVADAAVFGVPDAEFGQRLAAYVVPAPGTAVSEEQLKPYVRERLARYKVPREITVVDALPRTTTGKLQRRRLTELGPAPS